MEKKITKRDNYNSLLSLLPEALNAGLITPEEDARLAEFLNHEVELMDKRAEKAKSYSKAKSEKSADELSVAAQEALKSFEDVASIADIVAAVNAANPELKATAGKLAYRLNKLVEVGVAEKSDITIKEEGKSRKVNGYKAVAMEVEE